MAQICLCVCGCHSLWPPSYFIILGSSGWPRFGSATLRAWSSSNVSGFRFYTVALGQGFFHVSFRFLKKRFRWFRFRSKSQESPRQTKPKKGQFMNFALVCEFWWFSLGKQARFTLSFCSGMPLRKVHELTFLWFGLPGPLLKCLCKNAWFARFRLLVPDRFLHHAGTCAEP